MAGVPDLKVQNRTNQQFEVRIQEGTSIPKTPKKHKKTDKTAAEIYRKAAQSNGKRTEGKPSEEDIQRILAGSPRYKAKEAPKWPSTREWRRKSYLT